MDPEPRAYAHGFGVLDWQRVRNNYPSANAPGLLWYGVNNSGVLSLTGPGRYGQSWYKSDHF